MSEDDKFSRKQIWGTLLEKLEAKFEEDEDEDDYDYSSAIYSPRSSEFERENDVSKGQASEVQMNPPQEDSATFSEDGGSLSEASFTCINEVKSAFQPCVPPESKSKENSKTEKKCFLPIWHIIKESSSKNLMDFVDGDVLQIPMQKSPLIGWIDWNFRQTGGKHDKEYLEKAACVAFSLAKNMCQLSKSNSNRLFCVTKIEVGNIVFTNKANLEVDFLSCPIENGDEEIVDEVEKQRNYNEMMFAVGRLFHHLFTGHPLPHQKGFNSLAENWFSTSSSVSAALEISDRNGNGLNCQRRTTPHKLRRLLHLEKQKDTYMKLQQLGLPNSVCRLVVDMLESRCMETDLFTRDRPVLLMSDIESDLLQMVENPNSFLHDSLEMKLEPNFGNKLYCRDSEIKKAIDLSDKVSLFVGVENSSFLGIKGYAGQGKSRLALELCSILEKKGWLSLHGKFEQTIRPRPLSTITTAFDQFFARISYDSSATNEMKELILGTIDEESIGVLYQLIPQLEIIVPPKKSVNGNDCSDILRYSGDATNIHCRLYHVFSLLVKAISKKNPVLLSMDDLQWGDSASLDLLRALMEGAAEDVKGSCSFVLFVGTYRDCDRSGNMINFLNQIKQCPDIAFNEISLGGLSREGVNTLISDCLSLPRRLTRDLAESVYDKTTGNPFFIKAFIHDLMAEKLLCFNLSSRQWEWDEEAIANRTISDGVAELLARRLHRLPKQVLSSLRLMSCFGSRVTFDVLSRVKHSCGIEDIIASLDEATNEGLVKKMRKSFVFVHDIILESIRNGIKFDDQISMSKKLINDLLAALDGQNDKDPTIFIIVDLINRVGRKGTTSVQKREQFAKLYLKAGELAINTPDFASAAMYLDSGISYLSDDNWTTNYSVSLALFKNAALVHWAQGETTMMKMKIDEVLKHAISFDDKIDSLYVQMNSLGMNGFSDESIERGFHVLRYLGELFPQSPDYHLIITELNNVKHFLWENLSNTTLSDIPKMEDPRKIRAMSFMHEMLRLSYQQKSGFYPLIACRMVKLSFSHGLCKYSATGLASVAVSLLAVFKDFDEGYNLAKIAEKMVNSPCCSTERSPVHIVVFGLIKIWKEPIQVLLQPMLESYERSLQAGNISLALCIVNLYTYRSFYSGSNLSTLGEEINTFLRQISFYKRSLLLASIMPISNAMRSLTGGLHHPSRNDTKDFENDDENLKTALEQNEITVCEGIIVIKLMHSVIFQNFDDVEGIARKYLVLLEEYEKTTTQFVNIYRHFYGGLVAFHFYRKTRDQFWIDRGLLAISMMETWENECKWNFENKRLLLKAEENFSIGEIDGASGLYRRAISSAHAHRFIHEEAVACEFASTFFMANGSREESLELLKRAMGCYQSWGACEKANALSVQIEANDQKKL